MPDTPGVRKSGVGLVTPIATQDEPSSLKAPASKQKPGDSFGGGTKISTEVPANASAIAAGDAKLGKSTALVNMILTADKASFIDAKAKAPADKAALQDRDFAKRVGLLLQTTPYGATIQTILKGLSEDPVIAARYPSLKLEDLQQLHTRFPTIVPPPHNPVDMGASFSPTNEGYLDLYMSYFLRSGSRAPALGELMASPGQYVDMRFNPAGTPGLGLQDSNFPNVNTIVGKVQQIAGDVGSGGLFLRRMLSGAPAHWTIKDVTEAYNKYVDFHGAILFGGQKDTVEAARARATITPERVLELMTKSPTTTGATEFYARQAALRESVMGALKAASPTDNLYEILDRVAAQVTSSAQAQPRHYGHNAYQHGVFKQPPGPDASITAEDLARFVTADPGLAAELDRLIGERKGTLDKALANAIVKKFGPRLERTSIAEIVRTMQAIDPIYNEPLVQHLIGAFPKLFGGARIETGRVEVNFLLAQQIGDAMDKMFPGATVDDVAKFMSQKPQFAAMYPGFGGEDVKLLQEAYPFLPRWDVKPETSIVSAGDRMPLESLIKFAAMTIGGRDAKELQRSIFEELAKPGASKSVPDKLVADVDRYFARGLMQILTEATGTTPGDLSKSNDKGSLAERQTAFQQRSLFEKVVAVEPGGELDHAQIVQILTNKDLLGVPEARASQIATAILQARAGDLESLHETAQKLFAGDPKGEMALLKLTSQFLGREALLSKIEANVFQNKELRASFQRFSRIPLRLPLIQSVVDKYKDQQPLKDKNVLMVQHMLGQAYPQISGYKQLGMDPKQAIFVGIPYHKNEEVEQAVAKSFGVDVRVPPRDMDELFKAIEKGVDDIVAQHKKNGKRMLVVCDGPQARTYFKKKYPELLDKVSFTEQTAFGDRPEYQNDKSMRVVSYARSELKQKKEAKFIGQVVARAINAVLIQLGTGYEEKPVLILGYGAVGQATAEAFKGDRAKVYVFDPYMTPEQEKDAKEKGYTVIKDKANIAQGKFLMVGCSGHLSIDEQQIMSADPNAIFVSASSKLVEIDMRRLKELATDDEGRVRKVLAAEVNDQQTWHYWLKDGTIRTVIADGLPCNFNNINDVAPEFIDMTMSLSLAAAVESVSKNDLGFVPINAEDAGELHARYEAMIDKVRAAAEAQAKLEGAVTSG